LQFVDLNELVIDELSETYFTTYDNTQMAFEESKFLISTEQE